MSIAASDIISLFALLVSIYAVTNTSRARKEDFLEKFRSDLLEVELEIIKLKPSKKGTGLSQEDYALLETIRHKLRYQCCKNEKKKYLSISSRILLEKLQEDIEDSFGNILAGVDTELNRSHAVNSIKNLKKEI